MERKLTVLMHKTGKPYTEENFEPIEITGELADFLQARIDASNRGEISSKTIQDILEEVLAEESK